jgi:hypothetical protein
VSDDLHRRVESLEVSHKEIVKELKESNKITNDSINKLTSDVNVLVTTVSHLTHSIENMARVIDRTHQIELDLVELKSRTSTIKKLWDTVDVLKEKVQAQGTVASVIKIIGSTVLISSVALVFSILSSNAGG